MTDTYPNSTILNRVFDDGNDSIRTIIFVWDEETSSWVPFKGSSGGGITEEVIQRLTNKLQTSEEGWAQVKVMNKLKTTSAINDYKIKRIYDDMMWNKINAQIQNINLENTSFDGV